jgi:hypothetical protein
MTAPAVHAMVTDPRIRAGIAVLALAAPGEAATV